MENNIQQGVTEEVKTVQECKDEVQHHWFVADPWKPDYEGWITIPLKMADEVSELYAQQFKDQLSSLTTELEQLRAEVIEANSKAFNTALEYHKKCDELQNEAYRASSAESELEQKREECDHLAKTVRSRDENYQINWRARKKLQEELQSVKEDNQRLREALKMARHEIKVGYGLHNMDDSHILREIDQALKPI